MQEKLRNFQMYWNSSRDAKLAFICGHVNQISVRRRYKDQELNSCSQKSRIFNLVKDDSSKVHVCKVMFCWTLQISHGSLDRALKRTSDNSFFEKWAMKVPAIKTKQSDLDAVKKHINSLAHCMSHYCRN